MYRRLEMETTESKFSKSSILSALDSWKDPYVILIPIVLIIVAELLLYAGQTKAGITLHVVIVLALSLSMGWLQDSHVPASFQVLILLPLLRLLNISMPVFSETTLYLYVYIYTPMFLAVYFLMRQETLALFKRKISLEDTVKYVFLSFPVAFGIAYGEYHLIDAGNLVPDLSFVSILKIFIIMTLFVGLVEELVFRSFLQTRLEESFGDYAGLFLAALLFGIMHSGYGTLYEMIFVAFAGLVLGYMYQRTRSLFLVSLTHGLTNTFLFALLPLLS